jgi:hypothetical protein
VELHDQKVADGRSCDQARSRLSQDSEKWENDWSIPGKREATTRWGSLRLLLRACVAHMRDGICAG